MLTIASLGLLTSLFLAQPDLHDVKARAAAIVPDSRQVAWQRLEFTMFIHFGMNTFTNREWGEGNEDPKLFNPSDLDANQWAQCATDAGMRAIVLVAKHHDGFCLWPSKFTEHSVKNSPWRGGTGDLVREVADACRAHHLKFGVYLSPADLHEPTYGQSDKYNAFFLNQLRELLTNYGDICEVWFDGATPRDKGQVYDYQAWYKLIRELQPNAAIFGRGPDIRWVGNEAGKTRESEWSVIPLPAPASSFTWPDMTAGDLGSIAQLAKAQHLHWYPAETDTSIRPGWFWHADQNDKVRTLDDLLDCYYGAVGGNSVLLLNVPPDSRGRIHENDAARLKEVGAVLRSTFANNLATGASSASSIGDPTPTLDSNPDTFWTTPDDETEPTLTFTLKNPARFNVIMLQEHIQSGQRIEKFAIDIWDQTRWAVGGSGWREVSAGTTVGYKKLIRIPTEESNRIRIRFLDSRIRPTLAELGLFLAPSRLPAPTISRGRSGEVTLVCDRADVGGIVYTTDGSEPAAASSRYAKPFPLPRGGVVRARAVGRDATKDLIPGTLASAEFDIAKTKWKVASVSSDQADAGEGASNAIDDNPDSIWHTRYSPDTPQQPHSLVIDLGESLPLKGFTYTPRRSGPNGTIIRYEVSTSEDNKTWAAATSGEFANMKNHPVEQRVPFSPRTARYLKFTALSEVNNRPWASAAELGIITR